MLVDLHCHTKKTKKGEASSRDVDAERFAKKVRNAGVKIVAITNHNVFDKTQYLQFKSRVEEFCILWPGIEIDIRGERKKGHLIVIANPNKVELFDQQVKKLTNNFTPDNCELTVNFVFECLDICDVFYIPHFHKDPYLDEEDIEKLYALLLDKSRLLKETSNFRSLGVYSNFDHGVIIGSDVHNWNEYEQSTFANLRLPVSNYNQFCLLAKKDKNMIDTLLNAKKSHNIPVSPHEGLSIPLVFYEDINIIFGQKGTGKSKILASISGFLLQKSVPFQSYYGSNRGNDFSKLLIVEKEKCKLESLGVDPCLKEIDRIRKWEDCIPTQIRAYKNWIETKSYSNNKIRMKITNAVALSTIENDDLAKSKYSALINKAKPILMGIEIDKYLDADEKILFFLLLVKIFDGLYREIVLNWIEVKSIDLTNFSIDKIKSIADLSTNSVSKPNSLGFEEFVKNRFKLKKAVTVIQENMKEREIYEDLPIGELEDKGKISIRCRFRMLCKESKAEEFSIGIQKLKKIQKALTQISDDYANKDLVLDILEFDQSLSDADTTDLSPFMGAIKYTISDDALRYEPSEGEKGILLLQKILDEESNAYILDEPELGMGNSYVNNTIIPKLADLAKAKKIVIIATHNANIAVRLLPYMSIFRTHSNGTYSTFVGNPFFDELVNIDNVDDRKSWTTESMHTLEGGAKAFYERRIIYESGNKNN